MSEDSLQMRASMTEEKYLAMMDEIWQLFDAEPGTPEAERLEKLVALAEQYEDEHYPMGDVVKPRLCFQVEGVPVPKQSFRYAHNKRSHADPRVKAWQDTVSLSAVEAMQGRPPLTGDLVVELTFFLPDHRRRDLDNLSKAVLDGCNKIIWEDDKQIYKLVLVKLIGNWTPGVIVYVRGPEVELDV